MTSHSHPDLAPAPASKRAEWLAVLAHAPRDLLKRHVESLPALHFEVLRAPEVGLAMLRGRIGNTGDRFNVGEATITRCVLRHREEGASRVGVGYVLGRDPERVDWIARLDALLQNPRWHDSLQARIIAPLAAESLRRRAGEQAETASSRVHFFNLQPEASS